MGYTLISSNSNVFAQFSHENTIKRQMESISRLSSSRNHINLTKEILEKCADVGFTVKDIKEGARLGFTIDKFKEYANLGLTPGEFFGRTVGCQFKPYVSSLKAALINSRSAVSLSQSLKENSLKTQEEEPAPKENIENLNNQLTELSGKSFNADFINEI
jgi:hypothetical protein